jgi:soluble lytic murein transglycosylase-like protein
MVRSALLAAVFCALTPALAQAQLYSWKDASGRLIISDKPKDPLAKTYLVFGSAATESTAATTAGATGTTGSFGATRPASPKAALYDDLIVAHANEHALSPEFVRAVIQAESAFDPYAKSSKGAMGLMQLMPHTAAAYRVLNAYNPAENIRAGVAYLKSLMTRYDNDVSLALAAYNAGPGAVDRYGRTVPPYKETRNYVARIKGNTDAARTPNSSTAIYKIVRVVDGHEIVSYSNKPSPGAVLVKR